MPEMTFLIALVSRLRARARCLGEDTGSISLEQAAWAAGLLAIALIAIGVIGAAVASYTGKL